ncbi:MAG: AI-2E family transporter [Ardenticatenaceae bacterium]|nr:AI-2E family transporter [Ardenticatenaceae bacterium]
MYTHGFLRLIPRGKRDRGAQVLHAVKHSLWWWLLGQMTAMAVIGVLKSLGLWLLGVPLPLTLGLLAALLTFIPNFGPITAGTVATLVALTESPMKALYTILLAIGVQFIESHLVTPLVQREAVALPPAFTISGQVLMGALLGFRGLVFAVPLLAASLVVVKMLYIEDVLGEPAEVEGEQEAGDHSQKNASEAWAPP